MPSTPAATLASTGAIVCLALLLVLAVLVCAGAVVRLRKARRAAADLFEHLPVPAWRLDPDGAVRASNARARALADGELGDDPAALLRRAAETGRAATSGGLEVVRTSSSAQGEAVLVSAPGSAPANEAADWGGAERLELFCRLTRAVAHRSNNHLTSVLGFTEIALNELPHTRPERRDLEEVRRAGAQAAELLRQLLSFAAAAAPAAFEEGARGRPVSVDLVPLVDGLAEVFGLALGSRLEVEVRHREPVAWAIGEPHALERLVCQLGLLAPLVLEAGGRGLRLVTGSAPGAREGVEVAIEFLGVPPDRGVLSIPAAVQSSLEAAAREVRGDLLPNARASGGWTVRLPRGGEPAAALPSTGDASGAAGEGATILVVEDELLVRRVICTALRDAGYRVIETGSQAEAETLAAEFASRIDLLLCDLVLPGASGLDLAQELRETNPDLRVLIVSGYGDTKQPWKHLPRAEFLAKPFTTSELLARLRAQLTGRARG